MGLANTGTTINQITDVYLPLEQVKQNLVFAAQGDGATTSASGNTITITRKYIPMWAIIVAIVGFFLAFIGLLALLFKETETAYLQLDPLPNGATRVTASGTLLPEVWARISMVLSNMQVGGAGAFSSLPSSAGAQSIPGTTAVGWLADFGPEGNSGVVGLEKIVELIQSNKISRNTWIWVPNAAGWQLAGSIPELSALFTAKE